MDKELKYIEDFNERLKVFDVIPYYQDFVEIRSVNLSLIALLDEIEQYDGELREELLEATKTLLELQEHSFIAFETYLNMKEKITKSDDTELFGFILKYKSLIRDLNNILIPYRDNAKIAEYVRVKMLVDELKISLLSRDRLGHKNVWVGTESKQEL